MKKLVFSLVVLLFSMLLVMAQETPRGFNFQAVARNDDGSPKANASMDVIFGIFPDHTSIIPLYKETHTVTTDQFGVFSATIGSGTPTTGDFSDLPFQDYNCELAVWQMDGVTEIFITRTRLLSVPYAKTANHSDVTDTAVYATQAFFPAGMIVPFAGPEENIPPGWILCDGSAISRTGYANLFNAIGSAWGSGNGSTTFNVPDLRGVFLRGIDNTRNLDPDKNSRTASMPGGNTGNNVGSRQADAMQNITGIIGDFNIYAALHGASTGPFYQTWVYGSTGIGSGSGDSYHRITMDLSRAARTSTENRPQNVYVNYIIKL